VRRFFIHNAKIQDSKLVFAAIEFGRREKSVTLSMVCARGGEGRRD
jgi:hypothetical protein